MGDPRWLVSGWLRIGDFDPSLGFECSQTGDTATSAQSKVVGVLMLTVVVILLVGMVGMFVLSGVDTTESPSAEVEIVVDATTVSLAHAGGDDLAEADVHVALGRGGSGEVALADFTETKGDGDGRFEGGERRETSHGASDVLAVTVVHEPTNEVLAREILDVPD